MMFLFGIERLGSCVWFKISSIKTVEQDLFEVNGILKYEVLTVTKCSEVFSDVHLLSYRICLRLIT
jgi:hypothetical protein